MSADAETGSTLPPRLGNDVVDLRHPKVAPGRDRSRLMARILDRHERAWVLDSGDEEQRLRLWAAWAAKECGYKVACKWPGSRPVFRHADFGSRLELHAGDLVRVTGTVWVPREPGERIPVAVSGWASDTVIHLAGTGGEGRDPRLELGVERLPDPSDVPLAELREHFSDEEWEGIHGRPSAHARLLARARLAAHLGADESELQIVTSRDRPGRTPPRIRLGGRALPDVDLSISHHGSWVAWALLLPGGVRAPAQNPGR